MMFDLGFCYLCTRVEGLPSSEHACIVWGPLRSGYYGLGLLCESVYVVEDMP